MARRDAGRRWPGSVAGRWPAACWRCSSPSCAWSSSASPRSRWPSRTPRFRDTEGRRALAVAERLAVTRGSARPLPRGARLPGPGPVGGRVRPHLLEGRPRCWWRCRPPGDRLERRAAPRRARSTCSRRDALRRPRLGGHGGRAPAPRSRWRRSSTSTPARPTAWSRWCGRTRRCSTTWPRRCRTCYLPGHRRRARGASGSLLLARRVKRQTLGLEPREIAGLVEQREALLHGIKEGVLAVDLDHRITMVNDEAAHLLGIPPDLGRPHARGGRRDRRGWPRSSPARWS